MIKYLLSLIFIFGQMSWATDIKFDKEVSIQSDLKKEITTYWQERGERKFEKTYFSELPYLQYIHTQDWYESFFANAPKISSIKVTGIKKQSDESYVINILVYMKHNPTSPTFLHDKWIKIDKRWYHKYNDNPLPM